MNWFLSNMHWLFSGLGLAIVVGLIRWAFRLRQQRTYPGPAAKAPFDKQSEHRNDWFGGDK